MLFLAAIIALLSFVANALPAASGPRGDGRGATIFTAPQLQGDYTAVPANKYCNDLNNIFGNFDGRVRSLTVARGYRCQVYVNNGCSGNSMNYGSGVVNTLPGWLDQKIHSMYCFRI